MRLSALLCLIVAVIAGFIGLLAPDPAAETGRVVFGIFSMVCIVLFAASLFGERGFDLE